MTPRRQRTSACLPRRTSRSSSHRGEGCAEISGRDLHDFFADLAIVVLSEAKGPALANRATMSAKALEAGPQTTSKTRKRFALQAKAGPSLRSGRQIRLGASDW